MTPSSRVAPFFISQTPTTPPDERQRMSAVPSPLKSPLPTIDHPGAEPRLTPLATWVPFINHTTPWEVEVFCQRMSDFASRLKSESACGTDEPVIVSVNAGEKEETSDGCVAQRARALTLKLPAVD